MKIRHLKSKPNHNLMDNSLLLNSKDNQNMCKSSCLCKYHRVRLQINCSHNSNLSSSIFHLQSIQSRNHDRRLEILKSARQEGLLVLLDFRVSVHSLKLTTEFSMKMRFMKITSNLGRKSSSRMLCCQIIAIFLH